jgi:hypothetical protein
MSLAAVAAVIRDMEADVRSTRGITWIASRLPPQMNYAPVAAGLDAGRETIVGVSNRERS